MQKKSEQDILQQKHSVIGSNNSLTLRNRSLYKNLGSTKATENTAGTNKRIKSKRAQSNDNTNKKKKIEIEEDEENTIDEYLAENDESEIENKMEKKVINKSTKNDASSINDNNSKAAELSKVALTKANDISNKHHDDSNVNCAIRVEKNIDSIIGKLANKNQNSKESDILKEKEQVKEKVKEQSNEKEKEKEKEKQNILEKMPLSKFNLKKSPIKIPIEQKDKIENELKETKTEKSPISTNTTTPTSTIASIQNDKKNSNEIIKNTNDDSRGLILIDDDEDKNLNINGNMIAIKESEIKKHIKQIDDAKILPSVESKESKSLTVLENKDNKQQIAVKSSQSQEVPKPCTSSMSRTEDDDDVMVLEDESSTPNRQQITHIQHQNYQSPTSSTTSQAVQFNSFINRQRSSSQSIMYSQNLQTYNQTNIRTMQLAGIPSSTALISNQGILMHANQQNNFYTPNRINSQIINNHQNHLLIVPNFNTINISSNIANSSSNNSPISSNTSHNSSLNNQPIFLTPLAQQQTTVSTSNPSNNGSAFKFYNNYTHD